MKKIAIEEHFHEEQFDLIEKRLSDMDKANLDMQVLSSFLKPEVQISKTEATSWSINMNNNLSKVVEKYPKRFASFAALALQDPDAAAKELERAVKHLGFKGTLIGHEIRGSYLDNEKYSGLLETAEKLNVPIYIHATEPSPDTIKPYLDYPILRRGMWGFAAETGLHAMRLICSGIFNKYPDLKIILGHMGEGIPFWLWRIDSCWEKETLRPFDKKVGEEFAKNFQKKPSQYFKDNFYVTTSGIFWQPALQVVYSALGADKILFAVDYPAESPAEAVHFMDSASICDTDKEKIFHFNAEKLLKM